ncbi:MAG TPA: cysteine synthase A [Firmicutes bacterium]|nr:cysteine synthase A [Bacillota bacterium]
MIYKNIAELAGNTPLLELGAFAAAHGAKARVLAKLECRNPAGSVKDRVALSMILDAEARGTLRPGGVIIEPTSGNTGIGLAAMCAARGYRLVIVMPDSMSAERRKLIAAYGADLVLTPGAEGMAGAIKKAEALAAATPGSMIAGQFTNPANPDAHFRTTGPEIWRDTDGKISAFVAGAGTGGTVTGVGRYLKGRDKNIKIYAAEPAESAVISGKDKGAHGIQGIGAGFVPDILDRSVLDGVLTVTTADAKAAARELARTDGVLAGISGGCNVCAAVRLAAADEFAGGTIVTVLPDAGDRYLSTDLY